MLVLKCCVLCYIDLLGLMLCWFCSVATLVKGEPLVRFRIDSNMTKLHILHVV